MCPLSLAECISASTKQQLAHWGSRIGQFAQPVLLTGVATQSCIWEHIVLTLPDGRWVEMDEAEPVIHFCG